MIVTEERRRGRPRRADVEELATQATLALLRSVSFSQLTMEMVAERSGISKATLYRRWTTKAALVADTMTLATTEPIDETADVKESIHRSLVGSFRNGIYGGFAHVMASIIGEMATDSELGAQFRDRLVRVQNEQMTTLFERGVAEGVLRSDIPVGTMYRMMAGPILFGLVYGELHADDGVDDTFEWAWQAIAVR